ncbi:MAG: cupin domain-containing protein [Caldilineaceae bacterium]
MSETIWRPSSPDFRWQDVDLLEYKNDGSSPFKDVTRQVLFEHPKLACQWRYFEVAAGGYSTLERHEHVHAVMVLRGRGRCLVGDQVYDIDTHDLITVPPMIWHQFRATTDEPLGFLCLVNVERDRPILPTAAEVKEICSKPEVAEFLEK